MDVGQADRILLFTIDKTKRQKWGEEEELNLMRLLMPQQAQ